MSLEQVITRPSNADSLRIALELRMRALADSLQAVTQARIHASIDSQQVHNVAASASYASWLGVVVGFLGVLVGVAAIAGTVIVWRQSSDFKKQRAKLLRDSQAEIQAMLKARATQMEAQRVAVEEWQANLDVEIRAAVQSQAGSAPALAVETSSIVGPDSVDAEPAEQFEPLPPPPPDPQRRDVANREYLESLVRQVHQFKLFASVPAGDLGGQLESIQGGYAAARAREALPVVVPRDGADAVVLMNRLTFQFGTSPGHLGIMLAALRAINPDVVVESSIEGAKDLFDSCVADPRTEITRAVFSHLAADGFADAKTERLTGIGARFFRDVARAYQHRPPQDLER
jgi:hypothetical protein